MMKNTVLALNPKVAMVSTLLPKIYSKVIVLGIIDMINIKLEM